MDRLPAAGVVPLAREQEGKAVHRHKENFEMGTNAMLTFYVDVKLTEAVEADALSALASRGVKLEMLDYRRIPFVFPASSHPITNDRMIDVLKGHLRNADVPVGVQSLFVVPKDGIRWAVLLQEAFYLVTGYYPIMIQPWQITLDGDEEIIIRRDYLHMIDMHAVFTQ